MDNKDRLRKMGATISLVICDVDGVLTDGKIIVNSDGVETKHFNVRDGYGIVMAKKAGIKVAIVSGRYSKVTQLRAAELGIEHVYQGGSPKDVEVRRIADKLGINLDQIAFIGDDLNDIPALNIVGFPVAVSDACDETLKAASLVTNRVGGAGAVRELIDFLLHSRKPS